ncbi:tyrosine-type recombinase/integrase [Paraburkholderia tropica]
MEDELRKLLPRLDERLGRQDGLMFRIVLATYVRQSELIRSKKSSVDLERGAWRVEAGTIKTRQEFLVSLVPLVVRWMRELIDMAGESEWLCPARSPRNRNGYVGRSQPQHAVRRAFEREISTFAVSYLTTHVARPRGTSATWGSHEKSARSRSTTSCPALKVFMMSGKKFQNGAQQWRHGHSSSRSAAMAPHQTKPLSLTSNVTPFRPRHAA